MKITNMRQLAILLIAAGRFIFKHEEATHSFTEAEIFVDETKTRGYDLSKEEV